jgi:hypothetical protein
VISVQTIVLSLESLQIRRNHNWLKSLSFFFSPALRVNVLEKLNLIDKIRADQKKRAETKAKRMLLKTPKYALKR